MFSKSLRSVPPVAGELMVRRPHTVTPSISAAEGLRALLKQNHSGMPVIDASGNYLGVFSEKCCLKALRQTSTLEKWNDLQVRDSGAMATNLFCLSPDEDAVAAIGALLGRKVSGAPVTDVDQSFLGMFSEKTSMHVLIGAAYDEMPSAKVNAFMDQDRSRLIDEQTPLSAIATTFIDTPFRRLPVVRDGRVVGMVNRGNLLRVDVEMPAFTVEQCMDREARTVEENDDLLTIAEIFLTTPFRRLPVVKDGKLLGQVSRRDVLDCAYHLMDPPKELTNRFLYMSAVDDDGAQRIGGSMS